MAKKNRRKIVSQGVKFGVDTGQWLETMWSDGAISVEPLTSEQAAAWQAEHRY